nr:hypothetical protein [uncultured Cohaesibacter sp.]
MADYFTILKRAVDAAPDVGREQRQAIYDKARKALLAQLQNMDPPLAASEISKQRMALEEAVRAVERELDLEAQALEVEASADLMHEASHPAPNVTVTLADTDAAQKKSDASAEGDDGAKEAAKATTDAKDAGKAPDVPAVQSNNMPDEAEETSDPVVKRAGPDVLKHAVRDANALGAATNAAVRSAQDAADAVSDRSDEKKKSDKPAKKAQQERIEPTMSATVARPGVQPKLEAKPDKKGPPKIEPLDKPVNLPKGSSLNDGLEEEGGSGSRLGVMVGGVLLAGLLGGSGYLLYQNRDAFMDDEGGAGQVVSKPTTQPGNDQNTTTQPASEGEIPAKSVRTVDITAPSGPEDSATATTNDPAQPADQSVAQTPSDTASNGEPVSSDPASSEAASDVTAAQRSILYEEEGPNGQPGSANAGEALWELEGQGDDAEILISATIPNQNVTFSIKIAKNKDAELPASHLIEISAERATPDEARKIVKIPGLILKPTEQSRGEGLVGAAIKIADDLHWIALTAGEKEERYNLELLALRSWIDIPIQYNSGVRAILTLEKGPAGNRVIEDAIKAWGE